MTTKPWLSLMSIGMLTACGGAAGLGVLANLGFIAPIGGDFDLDEDPSTLGLDNTSGNQRSINIQVGDGWDNYYFESFEVTGTDNNLISIGDCEVFTGTVRGSEVTAVSQDDPNIPCFEGTFENEMVLTLSDGSRLMREFFPDLNTGTWFNINDEDQRFVFNETNSFFSGCEIISSNTSTMTGELVFTDLSQGQVAFISELLVQRASGNQTYTGKFNGNSGLILTSGDEELRLERRELESNCNT